MLDVIFSSAVSELQQTVLVNFPLFPWDSPLTSFLKLSKTKPSLVALCPTGKPFSPLLSRVGHDNPLSQAWGTVFGGKIATLCLINPL